MILKKIEEGVCPFCGSQDYDCIDGGNVDDNYFYTCKCNACNEEFTDWYEIRFDEKAINYNGREYLIKNKVEDYEIDD